MASVRWVDFAVICIYVLGLTGIGLRFSRRQTTTERYFTAKRTVPFWAVGMSFLTAMITSVTFIAFPGAAYAKDWALLIPGFLLIVVLALVGTVIIPFYRRTVGMSAFEYFGKRFGQPTRIYASLAFTLAHFSKMGLVFYLLSLTINSMTGWNMDQIILISGFLTMVYTLKGGFEAVVWTDVVQGVVIWTGIFVCLGYLLFLPPGGPRAVFASAFQNHKISFGSTAFDFSQPTVWVLMIYGFFWYLQRYTTDQTLVQRYLSAKSDRAAVQGVAMGALLSVPVWTLFMLIGTCTWTFYRLTGEKLPAYITKGDQVFPYFLSTHLPPGVSGLVMAALIGSAMCALSSDLNAFSSVGVEDIYRLLRPESTDRRRLQVAKYIVTGCGVLCIATALVLSHTQTGALSLWFSASAIVSGGLAGLFLLAFLSPRANRQGVYAGIAACFAFTAWATLTLGEKRILNLGHFNFPWHDYMIGAIGNVVLLVVGYAASRIFFGGPNAPVGEHRDYADRFKLTGDSARI
jgi:SSS family solute:Na+ symporter